MSQVELDLIRTFFICLVRSESKSTTTFGSNHSCVSRCSLALPLYLRKYIYIFLILQLYTSFTQYPR